LTRSASCSRARAGLGRGRGTQAGHRPESRTSPARRRWARRSTRRTCDSSRPQHWRGRGRDRPGQRRLPHHRRCCQRGRPPPAGRRDLGDRVRQRTARAAGEGTRTAQPRARTPFLGRDADVAQLDLTSGRAMRERPPFLVTITAPAGMGKTRLLEEFLTRLPDEQPDAQVVVAPCLPHGQRLTYSWHGRARCAWRRDPTGSSCSRSSLIRSGSYLTGQHEGPASAGPSSVTNRRSGSLQPPATHRHQRKRADGASEKASEGTAGSSQCPGPIAPSLYEARMPARAMNSARCALPTLPFQTATCSSV
jgi:hypothetical protein